MRKTILAAALVLFAMLALAGPASADCGVGYASAPCPTNVPPSGGGETGGGTLPRTGSDSSLPLAKVGIVVLGVGGALLVVWGTGSARTRSPARPRGNPRPVPGRPAPESSPRYPRPGLSRRRFIRMSSTLAKQVLDLRLETPAFVHPERPGWARNHASSSHLPTSASKNAGSSSPLSTQDGWLLSVPTWTPSNERWPS